MVWLQFKLSPTSPTVSMEQKYPKNCPIFTQNFFDLVYIAFSGTFQVAQTDLSELMRQVATIHCYVIVTFINLDDCPRFFDEIRRYSFSPG